MFETLSLFNLCTSGFDQAMIPIYDMINHNRGKVNTIASVYSEESLDMYATKDISAGEELFYAYHDTPDNESTPDYWGTPGMVYCTNMT